VTNSTAEENARRYNYSDRESALAETLEIAQERIMELVAEMESTQEAQLIVLETKESVLRSLARQNTHLAMEVSYALCTGMAWQLLVTGLMLCLLTRSQQTVTSVYPFYHVAVM
jgi:hypothetical protein